MLYGEPLSCKNLAISRRLLIFGKCFVINVLLGLLRSGRAAASQIERRVREAPLDLRLTVDSLEPSDSAL